ncbi:GntR family transcriptional regulator [Clostridium sp. YIM B02551]|uniref:GntR family transcriptional regulator n=1 Tax=Clostridium sp. YIM B02551 TaxID=2910679 RepID=UPI001EEA8AC6|nr:GntR family transcriptional regulator [Clostridium sp. YIM B02551]
MSNTPLYMEIYLDILEKIRNGFYLENSPIASERELCLSYHVSRSTIRQAMSLLYKNGYVYTVQGRGTYVKPHIFEQPLYKFYSFTDELKKNNMDICNSIISCEIIKLDAHLSSILNRPKEDLFHKIVRLRTVENSPLMIESTYLPKNRFFRIEKSLLENGSLYAYLKSNYSLNVDRALETFKPILPKQWQAELLNISTKTPCMLLERFSYEDDELIEYTHSIVRGDKYVFKVNLSN